MRRKTTFALAVAGSMLAGAGATLAQDAEQPSTTRGTILLPVGDKVHGYLRGGETHALRVHLAKGQVFSFSVNSKKRGDRLVMHLSLLDPRGNEVNGDARVMHRANGKKITVGPWRVPKSGTYSMELYSQTWFGGDYWGASKVRAPRRSVVQLPTDGTSVNVDVSAGSTIRVGAKGVITKFSMATPSGEASSVAGTDPLVTSLRAGGLSSSETGVYQFGARGAATLDVTRPRWRAGTLNVPLLPDDPSRLAQFEFVLGWNPRQVPVMPDPAVTTPPATTTPIGAPVPVGAIGAPVSTGSTGSISTAPLFIGGAVTAATIFVDHAPLKEDGTVTPPPVTTPPVTPPPVLPPVTPPPVPPPAGSAPTVKPPTPANLYGPPSALHVTDLGIPTTVLVRPAAPYFGCADSVGRSMFLGAGSPLVTAGGSGATLRATPWIQSATTAWAGKGVHYPDLVAKSLLPAANPALSALKPLTVESGDAADPYFAQTFEFQLVDSRLNAVNGTVVTTTRYYVDGHQVPSLLATGGDTSITWTVEGTGEINGTPWTLSGSWKISMHPVSDNKAYHLFKGFTDGITSCVMTGEEHYVAGAVEETLAIPEMSLAPQVFSYGYYGGGNSTYYYDPVGVIRNTLKSTDIGLSQTIERTLQPANLWPNIIDRYKHGDVKTITIDPTTPVDGVEDYEGFDWFLC